MSNPKSNEILAQDISYMKDDIRDIKKKLDTKYVSHETFDLAIKSQNDSIRTIVYAGMFLVTPIYGAIIALLFKIFTS